MPRSLCGGGAGPPPDQARQAERLLGVQARIAGGLVARAELEVRDLLGAAEALGDVLAGVLDVDPARVRAEPLVDLEEPLDLIHDAVEVAGLVAARRLLGVAVHRVALPDHAVPG